MSFLINPYTFGVAGPPAWTPASLFESSELGVYYDPSVLSSIWQDSDRTVAGAVDSPVGAMDDLSGNGNHALQTVDVSRPILRLSGGKYHLECDGVDDGLLFGTLAAMGTGAEMCFGIQSTKTTWLFISRLGTSSPLIPIAQDGSSSPNTAGAGAPTILVDRAALASNDRNGVHDAVTSANSKVVTIHTVDLTLLTTGEIAGAGSGFEFGGKIHSCVIVPGLSAENRALLEDWTALKSGVTLP